MSNEAAVLDLRHDKFHFCFLILLLVLGVAARETPEIMDLTDDFSNEGMVVDYEDALPDLTSRPLCLFETPEPTAVPIFTLLNLSSARFWFGPSLDASSKAGADILLFLTTQRK